MLKLRRLVLEDFGPFKGQQVIDFPQDPGVTILHGENGRGKTKLLNAIRFAFFGRIVTRGSREESLHNMGNWEGAAEGRYGFKVVLEFEYEGHSYELTRSYRPRNTVAKPERDADYVQEHFLRQDGDVLSTGERDRELARVMPEQVSRFFLFDGELLQEYEDLLRSESEMGLRIKEAIERILGVPVLTNARAQLARLRQEALQDYSKAAQKNQATREIGNHLDDLAEQRSFHEAEHARLNSELEELKDERASIEQELKKSERAAALLDEGDRREHELEETKARLEEKQERLKEVLSDAWRGMLNTRIRSLREELEEQSRELEARVVEQAIADRTKELIEQALSTQECPTCLQSLSEEAAKRLRERSSLSVNGNPQPQSSDAKLAGLRAELATLSGFETDDKTELVHEIIDSIETDRVKVTSEQDRIDDIRAQVGDIDQSLIRERRSRYNKVLGLIEIKTEGIKEEENKRKETERNIENLKDQLDRIGGSGLAEAQRKQDLYTRLYELFAEGVDVYRHRLRERVEEDATELFRRLRHEPDYVGLKINENYGLMIVHKSGMLVPTRSAGEEHIVALALMGALQRNAPLRGPIVMDSPFGRLDDEHTANVVRALPHMADQVVLLAYESELSPQLAREQLTGKLKAEYKMVRQSAFYTTLEKY